MQFYAALKSAIADDTGLANTILHIHGGLAILMIARLALRRSLGSFLPFWVVVAMELLNELVDRINHGSWRWPDTTSDLVNTLFWPLAISLGVLLRPLSNRAADCAMPQQNPAEETKHAL
jgi:hypothetical protein